MPLQKPKPVQQDSTGSVPGLTHRSSLESMVSPITPAGQDFPTNPIDKEISINIDTTYVSQDQTPKSAPATKTEFSKSSLKVPSKDLPFLAEDPYADDEIITFDKNKPIIPSRSGSVRSIMSTNSMQSLRRGLTKIKRKLSTRRSKSRPAEKIRRQHTDSEVPQEQMYAEDGITPINRSQTYMMGPSFHGPQRVATYQVSAMAF